MKFSNLATAILAAGGLAISTSASAVIQLGFILDESGSIGSGNYSIIKTGLANAIGTLVPTDSSYEISVVSFSNSAQTLVNRVLIDSVSTRTSVTSAILADTFNGSTTNMAAAFSTMQSVLFGGTGLSSITSSYVNFATDGVPDSQSAAITAITALKAAGVDNISVEGIGSGVDKTWLTNNICYPGPCDDTAPYDFPAKGFYIGVANAQGYADAIGYKIQVVTNQIPEPASMALVGVGLLGLGLSRRKQNKQ